MIYRAPPGALQRAEQVVGVAGPERVARLADERSGGRLSGGDDRRPARRGLERGQSERLVRAGERDAARAGEAASERCAVGCRA